MAGQTIEVRVEPRTVFGKHVARLRRQGLVPANVFGHGDSHAIQASQRSLEHLLAHGGRTGIVNVVVGSAAPQPALLKALQRDARTGALLHVDFQAVSLTERVTSAVPLRFIGEAPGTNAGGVLLHPVTELKIEAMASNLPDYVEVDLSSLTEPGMSIKVADVRVPEGVTVLDHGELSVAMLAAPKGQEEEEAAEAALAMPTAETAAAEEGAASADDEDSAGGEA